MTSAPIEALQPPVASPEWRIAGVARQELLAAYADAGVSRVMGLLQESAETDEALDGLAADARAAGLKLA